MMRSILHVDMNNFYASVECLYRPEIRNKPVAVTGDVENRHGIVLAKNMIAKKMGVTTGEAIWQAKNKAPNLVCVPPDYCKYLRFSHLARNILYNYTDRVEAFGLDENWADITGSLGLFSSAYDIAEEIRQRVKDELGVTVSIGLSWNKIFAKLGSDCQKPDAITVITKDNYRDIVWPLPVSDLLYVGRATTRKLLSRGIVTIGDLANSDPRLLHMFLGKWGLTLSAFAKGLDESPVRHIDERAVIKSIENSITAPRDLTNDLDARLLFICLAESVAARLRENMLKCCGVEISIRDNTLYTVTRQMQLIQPTSASGDLLNAAMQLLYRHYDFYTGKHIRSMGLRGIDLVTADNGFQLSLFDNEQTERKDRLGKTIDELRRRYGHQAVFRASCLLDKELTKTNIKDEHTIHPVSYFR